MYKYFTKTKKLLTIAILLVFCAFSNNVMAWEGNGTTSNPWKIGDGKTNTTIAVTAVLNGNSLTISGKGNMADFWSSTEGEAPWWFNTTNRNAIQFVTIENGVTNIGQRAFKDCSNLQAIAIPNSVLKINEQAFYNCTNLLAIANLATTPQNIASGNVFQGVPNLNNIYLAVPAQSIKTYQSANVWSNFTIRLPYTLITENLGDSLDAIIMDLYGYAYYYEYQDNNLSLPKRLTVNNEIEGNRMVIDYNNDALPSYILTDDITIIIDKYEGNLCYGYIQKNDGTQYSFDALEFNKPQWNISTSPWEWANIIAGSVGCALFTLGPPPLLDIAEIAKLMGQIGCAGAISNLTDALGFGSFMPSSTMLLFIKTGWTAFSCGMALADPTLISATKCLTGSFGVLYGWYKYFFSETGCANGYYTLSGGTLTIIENKAFSCSPYPWNDRKNEITKLIIRGGVTSIPSFAFSGCNGLTNVSIPNSVTLIDNGAFADCANLKNVTLEDGEKKLTIYSGNYNYAYRGAFNGCPINTLLIGRNLDIPNGNYSETFRDITTLNSVIISEGVSSLGNSTFQGCTNLTSINIPNSCTTIETHMFYNCNKLKSITIPHSATLIKDFAFYNTGLTSITIPSSVTSIENGAFADCTNLTSVTLEDGEKMLLIYSGNYNYAYRNAFNGCPINTLRIGRNLDIPNGNYVATFSNITTLISVTVSKGVTSLGSSAFKGCTNLKDINIPSSFMAIEGSIFENCNSLTNIAIPNSITSIRDFAFYGSGLTNISIPSSVTSIENGAFADCTNLKNVTLENGENTLLIYSGNYNYAYRGAFNGCPINTLCIGRNLDIPNGNYSGTFSGITTLVSIIIGNKVTSIGNSVFSGCTGVTQITSNATTPPTIQSNTFNNINRSIPVYINCNYLTDYQTKQYWSAFTNYQCAVQVVPASISAVVNFPAIDNAASYALGIYSDENHTKSIAELHLDTNGNLRAEQKTLSCTVSGLKANTQYYYSLTPYNSSGYMLTVFTGDFTTTANNSIEYVVANQMNIYPNPAKEEIFINSELQIGTVEIYSLAGSLMISENNFNEKISVSALPQGVYLLKIHTDKGVAISKIVKE